MDNRTQANKVVSSDEWYTPKDFLCKLGEFDCDPCAAPADVRPFQTAPICWTKADDGLHKAWQGVVWCNPPYSMPLLRQFIEHMALHNNGIALVVNRTDKIHITQKPVALMEEFLLLSTKEGDLVLDPFMGSGTTAVACHKTNRRFIGFELDEEYHKAAVRRVDSEQRQLTLF